MTQFVAFRPDVEVVGSVVLSVVDGMGEFTRKALKILAQHGIKNPEPELWYPQQNWLDAFKTISEKIGPLTLFAIGKRIPEHAEWPPGIETIEQALAGTDATYHLSHRLNGKVMYDPATGEMMEGIGHYRFTGMTGPTSAEMVCDNPYPSEFDRGIITALCRKFKAGLEVRLDPSKPTRTQGADSCTYLIEW
jgi:hypothetical protein